MAAFAAWTESEEFKEAHRNPPPAEWFVDEGEVTIHEVAFKASHDDAT